MRRIEMIREVASAYLLDDDPHFRGMIVLTKNGNFVSVRAPGIDETELDFENFIMNLNNQIPRSLLQNETLQLDLGRWWNGAPDGYSLAFSPSSGSAVEITTTGTERSVGSVGVPNAD